MVLAIGGALPYHACTITLAPLEETAGGNLSPGVPSVLDAGSQEPTLGPSARALGDNSPEPVTVQY